MPSPTDCYHRRQAKAGAAQYRASRRDQTIGQQAPYCLGCQRPQSIGVRRGADLRHAEAATRRQPARSSRSSAKDAYGERPSSAPKQ